VDQRARQGGDHHQLGQRARDAVGGFLRVGGKRRGRTHREGVGQDRPGSRGRFRQAADEQQGLGLRRR